jgi:hypothetical protein
MDALAGARSKVTSQRPSCRQPRGACGRQARFAHWRGQPIPATQMGIPAEDDVCLPSSNRSSIMSTRLGFSLVMATPTNAKLLALSGKRNPDPRHIVRISRGANTPWEYQRVALTGSGAPTAGHSTKAICRDLGVSRKVVRKVIRSEATEFRYERRAQPLPKAGPWSDKLDHPATPLPSFANSNTATTIVIVNPLLVSAPLIIWEWR